MQNYVCLRFLGILLNEVLTAASNKLSNGCKWILFHLSSVPSSITYFRNFVTATWVCRIRVPENTTQKMKFPIKDFFSKCEETLNGKLLKAAGRSFPINLNLFYIKIGEALTKTSQLSAVSYPLSRLKCFPWNSIESKNSFYCTNVKIKFWFF